MLVFIAGRLAWDLPVWDSSFTTQISLHLAQALIFSWLAITLHRLVLLDEGSAGIHFTLPNGLRVVRYVGVIVAFWATYLLIYSALLNGVAFASGLSYVAEGEVRDDSAWRWIFWVTGVAALFPMARAALVLPATAVDEPLNLRAAWRRSRHNTTRLVIIIGVLPYALTTFEGWLLSHSDSSIANGIVIALSCVLAIIEVVALSLAFGALRAPAPPPIDPPG